MKRSPSQQRKLERRRRERLEREAVVAAAYDRHWIEVWSWLAVDFAYVLCEGCGQEQANRHGGCVVCGHGVARVHPDHELLKGSLGERDW